MAIPRMLTGFLSQSTDPYNIKLPWQISEQDGLFAMNYRIEDATRDNLLAWAKTNWGERPYSFRFGLDARRYLFEPVIRAKEALLMNAKDQIPRYFPFLKITFLDFLTSEDDEQIGENAIVFRFEAVFRDNEDRKISISEEIGL